MSDLKAMTVAFARLIHRVELWTAYQGQETQAAGLKGSILRKLDEISQICRDGNIHAASEELATSFRFSVEGPGGTRFLRDICLKQVQWFRETGLDMDLLRRALGPTSRKFLELVEKMADVKDDELAGTKAQALAFGLYLMVTREQVFERLRGLLETMHVTGRELNLHHFDPGEIVDGLPTVHDGPLELGAGLKPVAGLDGSEDDVDQLPEKLGGHLPGVRLLSPELPQDLSAARNEEEETSPHPPVQANPVSGNVLLKPELRYPRPPPAREGTGARGPRLRPTIEANPDITLVPPGLQQGDQSVARDEEDLPSASTASAALPQERPRRNYGGVVGANLWRIFGGEGSEQASPLPPSPHTIEEIAAPVPIARPDPVPVTDEEFGGKKTSSKAVNKIVGRSLFGNFGMRRVGTAAEETIGSGTYGIVLYPAPAASSLLPAHFVRATLGAETDKVPPPPASGPDGMVFKVFLPWKTVQDAIKEAAEEEHVGRLLRGGEQFLVLPNGGGWIQALRLPKDPNVDRVVWLVGSRAALPGLFFPFAGGLTWDSFDQQHPIQPRALIDTLGGVLDGIAFLQSRGLCHRDIKPTNLAYDATGRTRIIDLGMVISLASVFGDDLIREPYIFFPPEFLAAASPGLAPAAFVQRYCTAYLGFDTGSVGDAVYRAKAFQRRTTLSSVMLSTQGLRVLGQSMVTASLREVSQKRPRAPEKVDLFALGMTLFFVAVHCNWEESQSEDERIAARRLLLFASRLAEMDPAARPGLDEAWQYYADLQRAPPEAQRALLGSRAFRIAVNYGDGGKKLGAFQRPANFQRRLRMSEIGTR